MATRKKDKKKQAPTVSSAVQSIRAVADKFIGSNNYRITPREREVLYLMAQGQCSTNEMAGFLGISTNTVNSHVKSLLKATKSLSKLDLLARLLHVAAERAMW